jgi:3-isopropylmalate/(R)-2-methylmalate dehydratase large subunit
VIEYGGETVEGFNVPARLTLTNMSAEMGAKAAIVAPDEQTRAYLQENDRLIEFEALRSDNDAHFERVLNFDVSSLKPMIACPPDIDNDVPVEDVEAERVVVDQVFIGSCTNCRIDDLEVVYRMWKGRRLKEGPRVYASFAKVYLRRSVATLSS